MRAVSAYGLSKGMTSQMFQFYCQEAGLAFGHFVIANPFGPFEESRFVDYLMSHWLKEMVAVNTPLYVRDNIPVSLLAKAYANYCTTSNTVEYYPSGYVSTQSEFADLVARAMRPRLKMPCEYVCMNSSISMNLRYVLTWMR